MTMKTPMKDRFSTLMGASILCGAMTLAACADDAGTDGTDDEAGTEEDTGDDTTEESTDAETGDQGMDEVGTDTDSTEESTEETTDEGTETTDEGTDTTDEGTETTGEEDPYACINEPFVNGPPPGVDYAELELTIGSHCDGSNYQEIEGIERVVFLGDSVTVGTPPAGAGDFYRSIVADELAMKFDLVAPSFLWKQYDPFSGKSILKEDGDFASCSEWGARTDDFIRGGGQLNDCFPADTLDKRTLVITTMGGNDLASIAKDTIDGVEETAIWDEVESMLDYQRQFIDWLLADPDTFPNGVFVVFANVYEFTDGTTDLLSCPFASAAGFDQNPDDPDFLIDIMVYINTEYAQMAKDTGTDVVFMFEGFCGHGYQADNPEGPCYRGPGSETWFDLTCIHPTASGHAALADMMLNVINE